MPARLAAALVFVTSGAVLVLEILAARLLAPYVGVTLETYTAIIGTVLAGIALGHWIGGRTADRVDPRTLLGPLLVAGGALSLATIPLVRFAGDSGGADESQAILLSAIGFFLPAAVLSAVSPAVVKLQLRDLGTTGSVVGHLSAIGTAGSIAGTFLAGFVLVEVAATSTSILVTGGLLVALGLAAWIWGRARRAAALGTLLLVGAASTGVTVALDETCDEETTYHCARIDTDPARASGRTLVLDTLNHSYVDLDDPTHLEFRYLRNFAAVVDALAPAGPVDVVHVGGGGFTMPRYLDATRPGSTNTVLEIDGGLVDVATEHLGLTVEPETEPGLAVRVGDGRILLGDVPAGSADVVVGDAFGGLAVPWHLTTREAVEEVRRVLRPGGFYVANLIDYPPLRFVRAEVRTLRAVFPHVAVVAQPSTVAGDDGGNVVVVGATDPIDGAGIEAGLVDGEVVLVDVEALELAGGAPVLTDDKAPVDQWLARSRR